MYNGKRLVAMISGGKDSVAMIEAATQLGYEIDVLRHVRIMFDEETPADLPKVANWIEGALKKLSKRYKIPYEIVTSPHTFKELFLMDFTNQPGTIHGYPMADRQARWCRNELKIKPLEDTNEVKLIGIAIDESHRCENKPNIKYPLCEMNWTEAYCMDWCRENGLLSPTYTDEKRARSGCFFCHLQPYDSLKKTRKYNPEIWEKWLELDREGQKRATKGTIPLTYKENLQLWLTDYEERMSLEEQGLIPTDGSFRWKLLNPLNRDQLRVLFLDYSYESIASIFAVHQLGWRLDEIRTLNMMFDETTEADDPEILKYKLRVNKFIEDTFNIPVKRVFHPRSYKDYFLMDFTMQKGRMHGYPHLNGRWCREVMKDKYYCFNYEQWKETYYRPITADNAKKAKKDLRVKYPLIELGLTYDDCVKIVRENGLEAPRDDDFCWYCPFMKIDRIKELRTKHPDLWNKWLELDRIAMGKWNGNPMESPVRQKGRWWANDFEKRWKLEEMGKVPADACFRWKMLWEMDDEGNFLPKHERLPHQKPDRTAGSGILTFLNPLY